MILRAFQNLPILDQLSTLLGPTVAYRNMHFEPADFVSITMTILENWGLQVTVNAAVAVRMVSLDITGFEGQKFLNICSRFEVS